MPALAIVLSVGVLGFAAAWVAMPFPMARLDQWPSSPCVVDRYGRHMLVRAGDDEQIRIPVPLSQMSSWLVQATIATEDARFRSHGGVDVPAVGRAALQNLAAGRRISGASTITMQLCRMLDNRPRTLTSKLIETFRALQLERRLSKDRILETYLNVAPYGGNLCGVEAAARRYFRKHAADLSLAEAALMAGVPQSPARFRPGRDRIAMARRRDAVLRRMRERGMIDDNQWRLAAVEPLPAAAVGEMPIFAPHAAVMALQRRRGGGRTTIDLGVQQEIELLIQRHAATLPEGADVAAVAIDIGAGGIVALVGSADAWSPVHGQVNGATARRSPGSALKPFVYAAAFEMRRLGPGSMVYDVPIQRGGWCPENFERRFEGPICVADALRRSLNIPAILTAEGIGITRCVGLMAAAGLDVPREGMSRGGLAIVTGAIEVSLLSLTNAYATIGRAGVRRPARLFLDEPSSAERAVDADVCDALDDILSCRRRMPNGATSADGPWFMWKTGTSSGRRDAWAIGHNRRYAIGVWIGRLRGAGRPEFVGAASAEPLLAALFGLPALRQDADPAAPRSWVVRDPLPPPAEVGGALRICSPSDGATFVAMEGGVIVHPRANHDRDLSWFVDGRFIGNDGRPRLVLDRGDHSLRCVSASGGHADARISVR